MNLRLIPLVILSATLNSARAETLEAKDLSVMREPTGQWQDVGSVSLAADNPQRLATTPGQGVFVNGPEGRTAALITRREFRDVKVHVEFFVAKQSNSGVYLMGRYEVQILDDHGVENRSYPGNDCGGIYPRWTEERREFEGHSPKRRAGKPAGEWQSFDITFRAPRFDGEGRKIEDARFVEVRHNGKVVHEHVIVKGPTRAGMAEDEKPTGPLMIQGDHGPVAIRNLTIEPLELE